MKNYVLISDLHLGSNHSRRWFILDLLNMLNRDEHEVYVLGDLIEHPSITLSNDDNRILECLRNLGATWVLGNHDSCWGYLFDDHGLTVVKSATLRLGNLKMALFHGHQWDKFDKKPWKRYAINTIYRVYTILGKTTWLAEKTHSFTHYVLKTLAKTITRNVEQQQAGAFAWLEEHDYDVMACGHTHLKYLANEKSKLVVNTGCWTCPKPTYAVVKRDQLLLMEYPNKVLASATLPIKYPALRGKSHN